MQENKTGLGVSISDIKGTLRAKSVFKSVKAESINGAIKITVYICVDKDAKIRAVAEAVQKNVKEKVQSMTGTAVTRVDVVVADIRFDDEASEEE